MKLTDGQIGVINAKGNILVSGGPGSGKTTIAILKASNEIERTLKPHQKVLFLSFARASVSRVIEAIEDQPEITARRKSQIEVDTYHSFLWKLLSTHGYLVGLPRRLKVLTPSNVAIALSEVRGSYPKKSSITEQQSNQLRDQCDQKLKELADVEGKVCFDLFAPYALRLIARSKLICELIQNRYPIIILDEFQDTNSGIWKVIEALRNNVTVIALADPQQRIYDWIGADPDRLEHFMEAFEPKKIDLASDNHRSSDTEIVNFANDVVNKRFRGNDYKGVDVLVFDSPSKSLALSQLVTCVYKIRKRVIASSGRGWSLGVLVPTKSMTRLVSDALTTPPGGMAGVRHSAIVDVGGIVLAAELVAFAMQPKDLVDNFDKFVDLLCKFYRGRGGDSPSKQDLNTASQFEKALVSFRSRERQGKPILKNSVLVSTLETYGNIKKLPLVGNPDVDWRNLVGELKTGPCKRCNLVSSEVRNLRLLRRGSTLRTALSDNWKSEGCYSRAHSIAQEAFVREHFSKAEKPESGVVVMNMHKAKGKQFDETIIFEGWPIFIRGKEPVNENRIVRWNKATNCDEQTKQNFLVSATRAKRHTTLLTPKSDPCVLLKTR